MMKKIKAFFAKETVFCVAAACAVLTMFLVPPDKEYLHYIDFRVLCLLMCLMAVVAGLKAIGIFRWLTVQLLRRIHNGRILSVCLILLPFFCSMFVTNDVALIIFVPFTLMLLVKKLLTSSSSRLEQLQNIFSMLVTQTVDSLLTSRAFRLEQSLNI